MRGRKLECTARHSAYPSFAFASGGRESGPPMVEVKKYMRRSNGRGASLSNQASTSLRGARYLKRRFGRGMSSETSCKGSLNKASNTASEQRRKVSPWPIRPLLRPSLGAERKRWTRYSARKEVCAALKASRVHLLVKGKSSLCTNSWIL